MSNSVVSPRFSVVSSRLSVVSSRLSVVSIIQVSRKSLTEACTTGSSGTILGAIHQELRTAKARHREPTAHARARYRCFLPDLAGLAGMRRAGPMPDQIILAFAEQMPDCLGSHSPQKICISRDEHGAAPCLMPVVLLVSSPSPLAFGTSLARSWLREPIESAQE